MMIGRFAAKKAVASRLGKILRLKSTLSGEADFASLKTDLANFATKADLAKTTTTIGLGLGGVMIALVTFSTSSINTNIQAIADRINSKVDGQDRKIDGQDRKIDGQDHKIDVQDRKIDTKKPWFF